MVLRAEQHWLHTEQEWRIYIIGGSKQLSQGLASSYSPSIRKPWLNGNQPITMGISDTEMPMASESNYTVQTGIM